MSVGKSSGVWVGKESRAADKVRAELIPRTHGINWDGRARRRRQRKRLPVLLALQGSPLKVSLSLGLIFF